MTQAAEVDPPEELLPELAEELFGEFVEELVEGALELELDDSFGVLLVELELLAELSEDDVVLRESLR